MVSIACSECLMNIPETNDIARVNGVECIVGCDQRVFLDIGSVITVKHNGFYQKWNTEASFLLEKTI